MTSISIWTFIAFTAAFFFVMLFVTYWLTELYLKVEDRFRLWWLRGQ